MDGTTPRKHVIAYMRKFLIASGMFLLVSVLLVLVSKILGGTASSTLLFVIGIILLIRSTSVGLWWSDMVHHWRLIFAGILKKKERDLPLLWSPRNPCVYIWFFRVIGGIICGIAVYGLSQSLFLLVSFYF